MEVRDHVPQLVKLLQFLFNFTKHVILGWGEAEDLATEFNIGACRNASVSGVVTDQQPNNVGVIM